MTLDPLQLTAAIVAVGSLGGLVYGLVREPMVGAGLVLLTFVLVEATPIPLFRQSIELGGISVYPFDVLAASMIAVALFRIVVDRLSGWVTLLVVAMSVLTIGRVAWGIVAFGIEASVSGSRAWIYFSGAFAYAATVRQGWTSRVVSAYIATAGALTALAFVKLAEDGLWSAADGMDVDGQFISSRPVVAAGALLILQGIVLLLLRRTRPTASTIAALGAMGLMVLLLQHRTVWFAAVAIVPILYWAWAKPNLIPNERLVHGVTGILILVSPILVAALVMSQPLRASLETTRGQHTTFEWRVQSWERLTEKYHSPLNRIIGTPSGSSLERSIDGALRSESAHSLYVDALLSYGVPGLAVLLSIWFVVLRHRRVAALRLGVTAAAVTALVASQVVYGVAYSLGVAQGLLLGIIVWAALGKTAHSSKSTVEYGS